MRDITLAVYSSVSPILTFLRPTRRRSGVLCARRAACSGKGAVLEPTCQRDSSNEHGGAWRGGGIQARRSPEGGNRVSSSRSRHDSCCLDGPTPAWEAPGLAPRWCRCRLTNGCCRPEPGGTTSLCTCIAGGDQPGTAFALTLSAGPATDS